MKKIFYSLISGLAFAVLLGSCNKFNDQFEGLDEMAKPTNVASLSYTLTAADYATIKTAAVANATAEQLTAANAIGTSLALNSTFGAATYVPALLNKMYYSFDLGSNALITYNYDLDKPSYLYDLTTVNILNTADYQLAWGDDLLYVSALTPTVSPTAKLPVILAAKFPTATSGQYKFVEYNYSSADAVVQNTEVSYFSEDWTTHTAATSSPYTVISENGWLSKDLIGTQNWFCRVYSGNNYAQVTSYSSPAPTTKNETWMTSKEIDLSTAIAPKFTFDLKIGYWNADCLTVWISENFDGTTDGIATATWTDITSNFTIPQTPTSGYTATFLNAGVADLTAYKGKKVRIAFKYTGDGRTATDRGTDPLMTTTYQIDNIKVSEIKVALSVGSTEKKYVAYTYNGTAWVAADATFAALQPADYLAMTGSTYISSTNAPLYIPQLLSQKFPFAQEGNVKTVVYKSSSTVTYSGAMQFTFTAGKWVANTFKIVKAEQFVYTIDGWVFDPTVKMTMVSADYQMMVNYVLATPEIAVFAHPYYKNEEYYWGFASRYSNVSFRLSYRNPYFTGDYVQPATIDAELYALTTDAAKVALMWERLKGGMNKFAQLRYPNAVPLVSGIEVYYYLTTYMYYPTGVAAGNEYHEYVFKCTAAASGTNPPTFEYISDRTL
ncbi:MAG TPA: hypothetical protein DCG69_11560 [Bacteroidales bacterium]|nr:hypothetical protein [Bacteroidales bacterium]